jgi:hypothetical protein
MINRQRTEIPNWVLDYIIALTTAIILLCLSYTNKLLRSLTSDTVNPIEVCEKINQLKGPEYIAHVVLFLALILRGWWQVGIANFPFLFYNYAQYVGGDYRLDYTKIFSGLSKELRVVKAQALFFVLIVSGTFFEWATWVPPEYVPLGAGYHVMKNIQVSH